PGGAWHQVEADHFHRQAVQHALAVACYVKACKGYAPDQVEGFGEVTSAPVETALRGYVGEHRTVGSPIAEQFGFHVPAFAFTNQCHSHQLAVRALGCGTRALEQVLHFCPDVINSAVHTQAEILEVEYH